MGEKGHAEQNQTGTEYAKYYRANQSADNSPAPTGEAGTSQDNGRNGVQLISRSGSRLGGNHPGGEDNARQARADASNHIHRRKHAFDPYAGQARGLGIAADGVNVTAKAGAFENEPRQQVNHQHDNDRDGNPDKIAVAQLAEAKATRHNRLPFSNGVGHTAQEGHCPEGDDKRREGEIGGEHAVKQTAERANANPGQNRQRRGDPGHRRNHRDHAGNGDDRPDG